ncbi:MAG: DnaA ATPase domain-containing protein, partial [Inhella sp.]
MSADALPGAALTPEPTATLISGALSSPGEVWAQACARLAADLPEQQFATWIKPLAEPSLALEPEGWTARLSVPNRFKLDWIRTQYAGRLEALLSEVVGTPVRLALSVQASAAPPTRALPPTASASGAPAATAPSPAAARAPAPTNAWAGGAVAAPSNRLNPALTFDTLVAGRANQMARTAALHVAGAPGGTYNPLFIYGGVGLGKTHLVHAVGNALLADRPVARVLYLHAEQFISDVVK